jgi:DNA-binding transcriptional ArsR family regulator
MELLKDLGLVTEERMKNIKYFSINAEEVEKVLEEFRKYVRGK